MNKVAVGERKKKGHKLFLGVFPFDEVDDLVLLFVGELQALQDVEQLETVLDLLIHLLELHQKKHNHIILSLSVPSCLLFAKSPEMTIMEG